MACLFAARLAQRARITLLGTWTEALASLKQHGVRIEDGGRTRQVPVEVASDPAQVRECPWALVLVKTWQTARAADHLRRCLPEDGLALTLQNGLGNLEVLSHALGPERSALGVTTYGATTLAPGMVRPAGEGTIQLGQHERLSTLLELLSSSGFEVSVGTDVARLLWGKVAINAAINPVTALLRIPNGELATRLPLRQLMGAVVDEVAQVAATLDIRLPFADPLEVAVEVAKKTATNRSSMLQDLERGAPTEIDAICGAVVGAGEEAGVGTPINRTLWRLVRGAVEGVAE